MAETLGKLQIDLEARLAKFESDMGRAARLLQRDMVQASQRAERQMRQMRQSMERDMERVRNQARNVAAAVVGIFSVQQGARFARDLARVADGYANVQAKLRLVTADQNQLGRVSQQVFGIAQRTYSSLDSTATLVSRTTQALVSNGAAADQALTRSLALTETIQQAFAVSGATTQEASNAIIQLSQGLAAGALRGEEFNSIAEQGPRIMKALADSLGVTTGELRKMAQEGKLTAEVIEGALSGQAETIAAEFAQLPLTIERAMVQLRNEFTRFVGEADQASGASRRVAESIQAIARNLPAIISGFVTLAKVATAYFAVYRVAIPLLAAVRAAHAAWVAQMIAANVAMEMGIATAVSWQTRMISALKAVAGAAVAFFAGWEIGTWLRDQFVEVRVAGIYLVDSLLKSWERLKQFSQIAWEAVKAGALQALNTIRGAIASLLDAYADAASAADIFGIGEGMIAEVRSLAAAIRPTTDAGKQFADALKKINDEAATNVRQINQVTSDMISYELTVKKTAESATSAAGATGDFNVNLAEAGKVASSSQQMFDDCAVALATMNDQWKAGGKDARRWTREIEQQQDAVRQLVADLEMELQMVGMTNLERQIAIATRQAEAAGMGDQIEKIRALYTELDRMRQLDAVAHDLSRAFGDFAVEALTNFDDLGETIDDFFDSLGDMAKRAVAQMIAEFARLNLINPIINNLFGAGLATGGSSIGNWLGSFGGGGGGSFNGSMTPWLAAAGGALYGYQNAGSGGASSLAAGAAYGGLAWTGATIATGAALGATGAAAGAGLGAAAGGAASGAAGAAAAVPVVGWVLAAMAIVDMVSGGRLFGTRFRPESSESTLTLGADGADASVSLREVRQRSLFRGRTWRDRDIDPSEDAVAAAQGLFDAVSDTMEAAALQLGGEAPQMIDAALRTVIEYDKKGREKSRKILVDVLGRTWEEATAELAATRINAEAIIATIDSVMGNTVSQEIGEAIAGPIAGTIGDQLGPIFETIIPKVEELQGEASAIAERWRDDAEVLMQGAQFLLAVATDIQNGFDLLGTGTLTPIVDLIEEMARAGETMQQTYARLAISTQMFEGALAMLGVELDLGREALVQFSVDVVDAFGGLDAASAAWGTFMDTFFSEQEQLQFQADQLMGQLGGMFEALGLDIEDFLGSGGLQAFRDWFVRELPNMTAEQIAAAVRAGNALGFLTDVLDQLGQMAEDTGMALGPGGRPGGSAVFDPNAGIAPGDVGVQEPGIYYPGYMSPADMAAARQVLEQAMRAAEEQQNAAAESADTVSESVDRLSNALERWIETLDELQRDLLTDETLSVLTPAERLAEVERQYQEAFTGALAGDQASRDLFDQIARQFAEVGRDFFGSSEGYTDIFTRILADIGLLRSTAGAPATSSPALDNLIGGTSGGTGASASDPRTDAIVARLETVENLLRNIVTSSNRTANATEQTALNTEMQQERTYG